MRLLRLLIPLLLLLLAVPTAADARRKPPTPVSPFAWRGVIEGYYGTAAQPAPWSHGERTRMIRWMAKHDFNAYVHAPKADPFQTTQWRTPYSPVLQANFAKEIALARSLGVQWIPSLSPARGRVSSPSRLCFSCASDMDAMLAKLKPFLDAGARTVMVSFDDIERVLGPADAAVYGARFPGTPAEYQFARATADYLNALLTRLPLGTALLTVLPDYAGTTDSPFLQGIREGGLNAAIGVMWTGPSIRASNFTPADAAAYGQLIGRTPIVWENWVARDFVPSRLFLGPFSGRTDLAGSVQGFFFNPMNEPDLNMLPLATAGTWMADPETYRPRQAWRAAVKELSRGRQPQADELRAFAETSYSSGLLPDEAPTSTRMQNAYLVALGGARWTDAADALRAELQLVFKAKTGLKALPNYRIAQQAAPFLATAKKAARAGIDGVDLLAAERPSLTLRRTKDGVTGVALPPDPDVVTALRDKLTATSAVFRGILASTSPIYVYGCPIRGIRGCGAGQYNRIDDFLAKASALDAAWLPTARQATARVRVTAGGSRVRRKRDGSFLLTGSKGCGGRLLAVDGAGGETSLPLPACPAKR